MEIENIPSLRVRERLRSPSARDDPKITLSPSTREWFRGQLLRNHPECRSSGHFALKLGLAPKGKK